jgi:hypothetical protein
MKQPATGIFLAVLLLTYWLALEMYTYVLRLRFSEMRISVSE